MPTKPAWSLERQSSWDESAAVERPPLKAVKTSPQPLTSNGTHANFGYNAWADEFDDDFGKEKEVKMSFM